MVTNPCPVFIQNSEIRTLYSRSVDQEYKLLIALPMNYAESDDKYPVLYVLDPGMLFGWVTDLVRTAALLRAFRFRSADSVHLNIPSLIVVGIGFPSTVEEQPRLHWSLRNRDLLPTKISEDQVWGGATGGADKFLRFIRDELMPFVNSNYRIDSKDSTIVGHSGGGLFALYVLFHEPETFRRYVVSSPSLWWDNKVAFEYEHEYASKHAELRARLFLSVGSLEELDGGLMTSSLKELVKTLEQRKYVGLELESHVFQDEGHLSAIGTAICKGISSVFSKSTANRT